VVGGRAHRARAQPSTPHASQPVPLDHGKQPLAAIGLVAFVVAAFWHAQLGLQVVIEDYVHTKWLEIVSQLAVKFFFFVAALAAIVAIVRIALV